MAHIILFAALAATAPQPSMANDQSTVLVEYAHADLATAEGRDRLDSRVRRAARSLCDEPGRKRAADHQRITACVDQALKGASLQIQLAANALAPAEERYSG